MAPGGNMMPNLTCNVTIDEFRSRVYPMTYSVISVLGFVENGFVLCVLIRTYHEKTSFQIYMLNLAISDLLFVFTLPLRVVYYVYKGDWFFGDFLCRISSYTMYVNLYTSILFMTAMSFFRCIAIVFPIQNIHFITEKKAKVVSASIWIFVTLTTSPFLLRGSHLDIETNKSKCFEPPANGQMLKLVVLHYIALVVGFIFPFVTIVICYTMIIRTLLKNALHKKEGSRKKAVCMMGIVTVVFLLSFTPYHIQRTVHIHFMMRKDTSCEDMLYMQKSVVITLSLAAFNCCFDPLLYFFSGGNFRKRLSTFRKASTSSVSQPQKRNMSLKHFKEVTVEEKTPEDMEL
ncbi:cysteinyl leukotriene receptor 1 [Anolis carolinensis]|uniref:Cysteinyl leukotriene receptor 1 n=1 Tax=Anolis carolinensis TaxID=28377 RepID=H9GME6_ANOCA|nr:PREDICTED: cysteinyl leukotriene receptor 1 [Anolis carolinensis]|eukprot:XP_003223436.1 PREDICTED: cysteinyl leukotriene receptor 1 [Anolis carolinensis]